LKNLVLNSLHSLGVSSLLRSGKKHQLTVLSLHRVSNERNTFWNPIKPETFDQLLAYLKKNYRVISFSNIQIIPSLPKGKPFVILSFDDGYYDFYEHALPLLVKHDLPCNHNIVNECAESNQTIWTERLNILFEHHFKNSIPLTIEFSNVRRSLADFGGSWMHFYLEVFKALLNIPREQREVILSQIESKVEVDTSCRMMNWEEIKDCTANKVELGSHTYSHDSLGTIKDSTQLGKEILQGKLEAEKKLGEPLKILALPNGQTGQLADEVIQNSDYEYVLYVDDALNQLPLLMKDGPVPISRINLVDEPFPQMVLRLEQFHTKLRKYVRN
jgi:peptidoglycan/xylan/chitin deacetylase (PgdA/CDA1 family)